jgi:hypothetical protein
MITETEIFKYGILIENIVIKYLEEIEQVIILKKYNDDNKYDLIIQSKDDKILKIEIKGDRQAYKTNNFYIEHISHNKPSGINTTQSDILIYVVENKDKYVLYWININNLKNYININSYNIKNGKSKSIDCNGNFNGKYNYGYLIKIHNNIYYKINEIIKSKLY